MSDNPFREALELWGEEFQMDMMIEEMSELTQALCKLKRAKRKRLRPSHVVPELASHVVEEMADVQVMIDQMTILFGIETFNVVYRQKVKSLEERIRRAKDEMD